MNITDYFPSAILHAPDINPDDVLDLIVNNQEETHFLASKNFNPVFIRSCFNQPNCRLLFFKEDGFDNESRKTFVDETPPDRPKKQIVFISADFSKEEVIAFLDCGASVHIWNTPAHQCPSHTVIFLVNVANYFGRISINAKGYTPFLIDMFLDPPHKPKIFIRHDDGFQKNHIKLFIDKGKENIMIFREGFADSDIDEFIAAGATILSSGVIV